jgi:hypothetical protein
MHCGIVPIWSGYMLVLKVNMKCGERFDGAKGLLNGNNQVGAPIRIIRRRDFIRFGTCISCDKAFRIGANLMQVILSPQESGGFSLLFDERNINGECQYENAFNGYDLLLLSTRVGYPLCSGQRTHSRSVTEMPTQG